MVYFKMNQKSRLHDRKITDKQSQKAVELFDYIHSLIVKNWLMNAAKDKKKK